MKKILLLISSCVIVHQGWSQIEPPIENDSTETLKTVVITAYEQNRKLINIPAPVSFIGRAQLERFSNTSVLPALNTLPGVRMEERSPGSYRLNIRGSSLRSPFGVRNVKLYWNDIPFTDPGGNSYLNQLGYYNISSMDIIKGPASSLYGAGTGGAVLIKSQPATWQKMAAINYGIGSFDNRSLNATIKFGKVILLISALFFPAIHAPLNVTVGVVPAYTWTEYIKSFGLALIAVSFTYGGYQQTINFGDEVTNPQKTMPRGIITGIVIIILLYLAVNFAYFKVIGFEELKTSKGIAAIVAERLFGSTGRYVFSVLLFLAVLAYVNVLLLSNPRVMYAMSLDKILPAAFRKKNEKREVLTVSLSVFTATCIIVLFFADTFDKILKFTIFLDCIGMAFSAATLFILRKRTRHLDNTGIYKMKLYPLLPLIFIAAYIFVAISIAIDNYRTALTGLGVLAAFIIIYFVSRRFSRTTV